MGRRTKLTPEMQKKICDNIRLGMTYERAAVCAGICETTFYAWKLRGENASRKTKYSEFLKALKRAETEGEQRLLANIKNAALGGQWRGAAWILERRHPERWNAKQNFDIEQRITIVEDPDW